MSTEVTSRANYGFGATGVETTAEAALPITVTGGNKVGDTLTAVFNNASGTLQWARVNPETSTSTDIIGANALTYTLTAGDVGFVVRPYALSYTPMGNATAVVTL